VAVDMTRDQHALVGVRADRCVDVLARRRTDICRHGDGHLLAAVSPTETVADLLRDADRRNLTDGLVGPTDAPRGRETAVDVVPEDEPRGPTFDGVVVLLCAV